MQYFIAYSFANLPEQHINGALYLRNSFLLAFLYEQG
jgi:hypothetical protein